MSKDESKDFILGLGYSVPALTATEFIESMCDGSDYGSGSVETAKRTADNTASILARLVGTLYSKGLLSKDEVQEIGNG